MNTRRDFFKSLAASIISVATSKSAAIEAKPIIMGSRPEFVAFSRIFGDSFVLGDLEAIVGKQLFPAETGRNLAVTDEVVWTTLGRLQKEGLIKRACREEQDYGRVRGFGCIRNTNPNEGHD